MTNIEALGLQTRLERSLGDLIGEKEPVYLSQALTGKLRVQLPNAGFFTFDSKTGEMLYVSFKGYYSELEEIRGVLTQFVSQHKQELEKLLWSYDHISELED